jgi:hypothetical protein
MRSAILVGLFLLTGCEAMRPPTSDVQAPVRNERGAAPCRSDKDVPQCRVLSVQQYKALLRSMSRSGAGPGVVH